MSTLQTLDRGLRALDIISRSPAGITVADLAKELEIARAICYRIVATLETHSLVVRADDGRIRLGAGAAVLSSRFVPQFQHAAGPVLHDLAERTQATAFVSAAHGNECIVILVAEPEGALLHVGYRVGNRHPLDRGAAGIAILALRPEDARDPDAVKQARELGYSVTRGQLERGAVGVAAGVRAPRGAGLECSVGVVAIAGLDVDAAALAVQDAAARLSVLLTD